MARVTVEDCIQHVPNRFDLVLIAAQRARAIASGSPIFVGRGKNKDTVVALREIASSVVDPEALARQLAQRLQRGTQKVDNEAVPFDPTEAPDIVQFDTVSEEELLAQLRSEGIEPESVTRIVSAQEEDDDL